MSGFESVAALVELFGLREDPSFPSHLLVIQYDGMGGLISLDMSDRDAHGEAPVVSWDPGSDARGGPEQLAEDFGTYVLRECARALGRASVSNRLLRGGDECIGSNTVRSEERS
ncbi:hypothetical protein [Streptomyces shaanxiensis]|uniref:Uncharacterized protein n=1 Tax=Streptomyces shaanxiensis TaxID=653357 RepID=A0ABP7W1S0_9ACTN